MLASAATLAALRFEELRRSLEGRARTQAGKVRAAARPFLETRAEVETALALVEEARRLHAEPLLLPLGGMPDVRTLADRAARGAMLDPQELLLVNQALFAFEHTGDALGARAERFPALTAFAAELPQTTRLATRLQRSIEPAGTIADAASPGLKAARDRTRGLHRTIKARLDALLKDDGFQSHLQESYYSIRHDRYVVPVLAQDQRLVPGIVHNASQTGQTLFVEPEGLIGVGNDLAIAQAAELEEERQVLLELSRLVGAESQGIARGTEACAALDEAEAAASLADALQARVPELEPADGRLALVRLRHPLLVLAGNQVVPNDVELTGTARSLVVSGPNAGGKTITLTAVGLAALMVRAGLPVPVGDGSRLPLFTRIDSAVGDAQDLSRGLSTFSAHVTQLKEICAASGPGSLVLIDEIAADTDPREGAAIATAVLEALLEQGALALVTTHLEELKALAHLDPRFVNARVGFDPALMAPTYRLQLGVAGASSAIDVARRVGLAEAICLRATELARNTGGALAQALGAANAEREAMEKERALHAAAARAAEAELEQLRTQRDAFERNRRQEELKFREALRGELEFARAQLRALSDSLHQQRSAKAVDQATGELASRIQEQTQAERHAREALQGPSEKPAPPRLEVGARARLPRLDATVEILELHGDEVLVAAGSLKLRVRAEELQGAPGGKSAKREFKSHQERARETLERAATSAARPFSVASPKLDVRGKRAEEALRELEQVLDRATRQGEGFVLLVHGHGTGALKTVMREWLGSSPYVAGFRPGESHEGGDGVTVITLA